MVILYESINESIVQQLIEFGFNPVYSSRIFLFYNPNNLEEALDYLNYNNGIIQHNFLKERSKNDNINNNICFLCGESKEIHLGYIPESEINDINNINIDIKEDKKENLTKHLCEICSNLFIVDSRNTLECGHSFCNDCWFDFLFIKIKENKISFIKCLNYECQNKLSDDFIIKLLGSNKELIEKYKKYKFELEIMNNPNKKFCLNPDCNSYLELKNEKDKNVKCLNGHIFCFNCLKEPHKNSPCENNLDNTIFQGIISILQKFQKFQNIFIRSSLIIYFLKTILISIIYK